MSNKISQAVARPVRTATQLVPAIVIVDVVDVFVFDFDDRQYAAAAAFLTMVFGWATVLIEDWKGKAFLREIPEPAAPVADEVTPAEEPYDG